MIKLNGHPVNITMFPDKTSQVWKLSDELLQSAKDNNEYVVLWNFEHEGEIFHIIQLLDLLGEIIGQKAIIIDCPYLVYGRQDKIHSNESCFALRTFCSLFSCITELRTYDAHNPNFFKDKSIVPFDFVNYLPYKEINQIISDEKIDLILYPDKGASLRYPQLSENNIHCSAEKVRDQLTGEITGISIPNIAEGLNILVPDDIIQNGRTFIELAKVIMPYKPVNLILYASHAFCSAGLQVFWDAGYNKIYDRNGLLAVKP